MLPYEVLELVADEKIVEFFEGIDIHPVTAQLLVQRGVQTTGGAEKFLNPSYADEIGNPFDIHGMSVAVERIISAMKKG